MKNFVAFLFFFSLTIYGQNIIGIWQAESAKAEKGLSSYYEFKAGGIFEYHVSSFDGLNPIRIVLGKYKIIAKHTMLLNVLSRYEKIDAILEMDTTKFENNGWALTGGKLQEIKNKKLSVHKFSFSLKKDNKGNAIVVLDGIEFYKISKKK